MNPYESLRHGAAGTVSCSETATATVVLDTGSETATLLLFEVPEIPGAVMFGYEITLADGRRRESLPLPAAGYFDSARDAEVYFIGMMQQRPDLFSEEANAIMEARLGTLLQNSLFV